MSCSVHVQFPAGKPVTVSVNGVAIARDAIQREMQHHPAEKPIAAWQQAARALVIRELLLQRAKHLGLPPEPICDEAGRRETDDEALMRAVVEQEVTVPDAGRRDLPALLRAKQRALPIARYLRGVAYPVCSAAGRPGRLCRGARGCQHRPRKASGRSEFLCDAAKAYSKCPSAEQGGNLGQITSGQTTPEFERALLALAPGEICTEPVATRYGFHIIRLERKIDGRVLPYEVVAEHIADYLRESVQRRANAQYVARLASGCAY